VLRLQPPQAEHPDRFGEKCCCIVAVTAGFKSCLLLVKILTVRKKGQFVVADAS
jgi:hypothetical protein